MTKYPQVKTAILSIFKTQFASLQESRFPVTQKKIYIYKKFPFTIPNKSELRILFGNLQELK